jgi:predicted nuclease of predicted toxin-antitoxin system
MKLLVDMNLSPRWVQFLAGQGWQCLHWSSVGRATATDAEIMRFAAENDCVVLTYDLDFSAILAATQGNKPSVVQLRTKDISIEAAGQKLCAALKQTESELKQGALLTLDENRTRIRLLPIKRDIGTAR